MLLRWEKVCAEPYAQYNSNVERTVCTTENTTESHCYIYEQVSQRCGEAKSISISKSTPTP
jgi:hypothetical protein